MPSRKSTFDLTVNDDLRSYVEFLRDEFDGYDELVEYELTQPFRAAYRSFKVHDFPRDRVMPMFFSLTDTVKQAIELSRKSEDEPDDVVLMRILFDHLDAEEPLFKKDNRGNE